MLTSCLGIESQIRLREDGSGLLTLSYKVSQFMKNLDVGREDKRLPLPVSEEDFKRTADGIEGVRLTDIDETEDEQNVYIEARLEFDSIDAVNLLGPDGSMGLSLVREGEGTTFRQIIYDGAQSEEITEDSVDMIETFFQGYELVYSITVPGRVKSYSLGALSNDGTTVTYRAAVSELLQQPDAVILEVSW